MKTTITNLDLLDLFYFTIINNYIDNVDEDIFNDSKELKNLFSIIKYNYSKFKIVLTDTELINEYNKEYDINKQVNFIISQKDKSIERFEQFGYDYYKEKFSNIYSIFQYERKISKYIDAFRTKNVNEITDIFEDNKINNPFTNNNTIELDNNGKINYKKINTDELSKIRNNFKQANSKEILKYISAPTNFNNKYEQKNYLLYPLFKEEQLGIIYGKSGEGKSIFGLEIANFIAKGKSDWDFFRVDTKEQKVVYINFELSESSLINRYKNEKFNKNLIIETIDNLVWNSYVGNKPEVRINKALDLIEEIGKKHNSKIIFIDNLSNIADNIEQAVDADRFISELYGRKQALGLSIIFLGHTPKIQGSAQLTMNMLKGSSSLSKTFEVMVGFQRSKMDKNISYIKQIKTRDVDYVLDENNVAKFSFNSNGKYGWELEYIGTDTEFDLIDERKNNGRPVKYDNTIKKHILYDAFIEKKNPIDIQNDYSISRKTFYNIKKDYEENKYHLKDEYDEFVKVKSEDVFGNKTKKIIKQDER